MKTDDPIRVLLVEDNETDAFLVQSALRPSNGEFEIRRVETLEDARDALSHLNHFNVLVGDLNLPDSSHEKTLDFLLHAQEQLPVVVLNACDDPNLVRKCIARGVACYSKQKLLEKAFVDTIRNQSHH